MAIAYQTSSTATSSGATAAASQSVTVTKPTDLATDDQLIAVVWLNEDAQTSATLSADPTFSGFTKVSEMVAFSSLQARRGWVYRKTITNGGTEPASYTFTVNYSSTGTGNLAIVLSRFSGVNTTTPVDANSVLNGETTSTTLTFNTVTTTSANTLLVMCGGCRRNLTTTYNDGTKIADAGLTGTTAAAGLTATMGYLAQASAGASGNKTATLSGGVARENDGLIIALKDATPAGLTITSVTPSTFDSGITGIVIAGNNFGASQGSSTVDIGGVAQTVTAWSNTSITITSARGSNSMGAGQLNVTIR